MLDDPLCNEALFDKATKMMYLMDYIRATNSGEEL